MKRLYDVYGDQMIEYVSSKVNPDYFYGEDAVVAEEEDMKVYDKNDVSKVLDDDSFKGDFGYKKRMMTLINYCKRSKKISRR